MIKEIKPVTEAQRNEVLRARGKLPPEPAAPVQTEEDKRKEKEQKNGVD